MASKVAQALDSKKYAFLKILLSMFTILQIITLTVLGIYSTTVDPQQWIGEFLPEMHLQADTVITCAIVLWVVSLLFLVGQLLAITLDYYWAVIVFAIVYGFILLIQLITANIGAFLITLTINITLISYSEELSRRMQLVGCELRQPIENY